jgi:quercetin dioxygenase-like cupin family protein
MNERSLEQFPIHLGRGATAIRQPKFAGTPEWYMAYAGRHASDGLEGRIVAMNQFSASWPSWEVHPHGAEIVVCTAGSVTLLQEIDGKVVSTLLRTGEAAINPPGVWHTADVTEPCTLVFVTPGAGTQNRPR